MSTLVLIFIISACYISCYAYHLPSNGSPSNVRKEHLENSNNKTQRLLPDKLSVKHDTAEGQGDVKISTSEDQANATTELPNDYPQNSTKKIRPVLMMHGLVSDCSTMSKIEANIWKFYPHANVTRIDKFIYEFSMVSCPRQTAFLIDYLRKIFRLEEFSDGVTLICYSQGGILCRGIIQQMDDHKVHTLISLAGPMAGQFGMTHFLDGWWFAPTHRENVHYKIYGWMWGGNSVAGYWKDPFYLEEYLENSAYLPYLDNDLDHPDVDRYKRNFLKLTRLVLIGSPSDEVIEPWQSSQFGYYRENSGTDVELYTERDVYRNDKFGLRTLDERGGVKLHSFPNVGHLQMHQNQDVFLNGILPYLD